VGVSSGQLNDDVNNLFLITHVLIHACTIYDDLASGQVVGYLTLTAVVPSTQISPREGVSILLDLFCLVTFSCDLSLGASPLSPAL